VKGFASPGKLGESNDRWLDVLTVSARSSKLMGASVTERLESCGNSFHITNGKVSSYSTLSCWRFPGNIQSM